MEQYAYCGPFIDLHVHTTASDGSMTPAEVVGYARAKGLAAVAITDHDTTDGVGQAVDEGRRLGVEVMAGVEISVDFEPEMHLLGYFTGGSGDKLQKTLDALRKRRAMRNPKIIKKLNALGIKISMADVHRPETGGIIGRPHIAMALVEKGYAGSVEEAFEKYLAAGRPAYVKKDKLSPEEGIAEITRSGGIPVLAHPVCLNMRDERLDELLGKLAEAGLMGIEAYYTDNTECQTETFLRLAEKHHLAVTGGSDFHGSFKPGIELGTGRGSLKVPYALIAGLKCIWACRGMGIFPQ